MSAKVERLVNLTVALLEARRPLTLRDLRRRTGYYEQDDPESARRMFERDKDALRSLGIPVRVAEDPQSGEAGYIVDRRAYELPDVDLDRDEMAALAIALRLTGDATDHLALSKVAARAPDPRAAGAPPPARLALGAEALDEVADALVRRQAVRFRYRTGTGEESARTVDPYGIGLRRGAWYLVGRDHARDDLRSFRLDRVVGHVTVVGEPGGFDPPSDVDVSGHIAGPSTDERDVDVAVAPDARWAVEAHGARPTGSEHDGRAVYRFTGTDPTRLVPWLLGLGPDVLVVAPEDVRADVVRRLEPLAEP